MTSPAPGRCRPAAPPAPRPAPAAPPRRRIQPRDQDLRRPRPTASPPPTRRPCRQTSLTTSRRQEDLTAGQAVNGHQRAQWECAGSTAGRLLVPLPGRHGGSLRYHRVLALFPLETTGGPLTGTIHTT